MYSLAKTRMLGADQDRFGTNQVKAAYNWLKDVTSAVSNKYAADFAWYRANARFLSSSDVSAFAKALEQENAALTKLQSALFTFEQRAKMFGYLSGVESRGLGLGPIAAIPMALLLAILAYMGVAWAYSTVQEAEVASQRADTIKAVNQAVAEGRLPATALTDALDKTQKKSKEPSLELPWGWIAAIGVPIGAVVLLKAVRG